MDYYVYPLRFVTPVHFGSVAQGGNLANIALTLGSDSFFGACCSEISHNKEVLYSFIQDSIDGNIVMSSLFPFYKTDEQWQFYIPTPFMRIETEDTVATSFSDVKAEVNQQKKIKKKLYMRASEVRSFSRIIKDKIYLKTPIFGEENSSVKVNIRGKQSLPYYVGNYRFLSNAGLYIIVGFSDSSKKEFFDDLINSLGLTGIGGKRSSGYGKFELADDPIFLDSYGVYEDDQALYEMIANKDASHYMCLSTCVPQYDEDIKILKMGQFKLKKCSGFVVTDMSGTQVKRNSYYAILEGSVCPEVINGGIVTIDSHALPHKVYRNGRGFWIGVD